MVVFQLGTTHRVVFQCEFSYPASKSSKCCFKSALLLIESFEKTDFRADDSIVIIIKDNGVGMDASRIPDILDGNEAGIGISNTNERLKRYYNTEIEVVSIPEIGTTFTITIPISRGNKNVKMYNR